MKRLTAVITALALLFVSAFAAPLSDIGGHWAEAEISAAYENKTVSGDDNGLFRPDDGISRAEFMKMVTALLASNFSIDIPDAENAAHWAQKYYDFATKSYLEQISDAKYDNVSPGVMSAENFDTPIERWEMAFILDNALSKAYGMHTEDGDFSAISDMEKLTADYGETVSGAMKSMITLGIITGDENGSFNPSLGGTRAEAVVMLSRASKLMDKVHEYYDNVQKQQEEALKAQEKALEESRVTYEKIPTGHPIVEFTMSNGNKFEITLYPEYAPQTCANFLELVGSHFYDGLTFHRVVEGFMAQGGDPNGNGTGGSGKTIFGEFSANGFEENTLKHETGVVSMARSQLANSASSQFFICYDDASFLDGQYAAFGKVTSGMKTVENFLKVEREDNGFGEVSKPKTPIKISRAVIKKK